MDTTTKVNYEVKTLIEGLLCDRPVAYHPMVAKAVGSVTAGVLLAQFLYWTPRTSDAEGWFYKTQRDIFDETALSRTEQETARKKLRSSGVIEERWWRVPAKLYFRVNFEALQTLLAAAALRTPGGTPPAAGTTADTEPTPSQDAETLQPSLQESRNLACGNTASKDAESPQAITEITPETTTDTYSNSKGDQEGIGNPPAGESSAYERLRAAAQTLHDDGPDPTAAPPAVTNHEHDVAVQPIEAHPVLPPLPAIDPDGPPLSYIDSLVRDISEQLGDTDQAEANIVQVRRIWQASGLPVAAFSAILFELRSTVRVQPNVHHPMRYFTKCVRVAAGLDANPQPTFAPAHRAKRPKAAA